MISATSRSTASLWLIGALNALALLWWSANFVPFNPVERSTPLMVALVLGIPTTGIVVTSAAARRRS